VVIEVGLGVRAGEPKISQTSIPIAAASSSRMTMQEGLLQRALSIFSPSSAQRTGETKGSIAPPTLPLDRARTGQADPAGRARLATW
jgi:hypothetical protein